MKKYIPIALAFSFALTFLVPVYAFASTPGNITNVISNTFAFNLQDIKTDVLNVVGTALPYALGIMGIMLSLRLGVKFFRKTSK